jgi:Ser/Thr protein kinase RdoA (MazF antagonist)
MLRVYRAGWRTLSDVLYEIDVLLHLERKGIPVSTPVPRRDGSLVREVLAPEGPRIAVLFTFAPGREPHDEPGYDDRYGRAVASLHDALDDFSSLHPRFSLDFDHLLDQPLAAIRPLLQHRPDEWQYVEQLAERLHARLEALPLERLETGVCHGDFHGGNAHVDGETITFFDFDCCGPGWRAYEVAVFRWNASSLRRRAEPPWEEFLAGYTAVRPLADLDLAAVSIFVAIRHIWWVGLQCGDVRDWGLAFRGDRFFDQQLRFLKTWERRHLKEKRGRQR